MTKLTDLVVVVVKMHFVPIYQELLLANAHKVSQAIPLIIVKISMNAQNPTPVVSEQFAKTPREHIVADVLKVPLPIPTPRPDVMRLSRVNQIQIAPVMQFVTVKSAVFAQNPTSAITADVIK